MEPQGSRLVLSAASYDQNKASPANAACVLVASRESAVPLSGRNVGPVTAEKPLANSSSTKQGHGGRECRRMQIRRVKDSLLEAA